MMSAVSVVGVPDFAEPVRYAGFWIRAAAILIDQVIAGLIAAVSIIVVVSFLGVTHRSFFTSESDTQRLVNIIDIVIVTTYFVGLVGSPWQATLGKRWLGVYVRTAETRRLSLRRSFGRELAKILSAITLLIGYAMAGWTREKTALHDRIASTRVVYGKQGLAGMAPDSEGNSKVKSPGIALIWSLVIGGGGQLYNRDFIKGAVFLIATLGLWIVWLGWVPWLWSIIDAYDTANRRFPEPITVSEVFS
jgi:uncharacterized RDD family membrane protein YckC/TM2 domain-containing membrane protein YozV